MPPIVLPVATLAQALDPADADCVALAGLELTVRETQVANLAAAGHDGDQIAAHLGISRKSVVRITSQLVTRSGSVNRTNLIARLIRAGKIR